MQTLLLPTLAMANVWVGLGLFVLFGAAFTLVLTAAYLIFDLLLTKIDIQRELNDGNIAVAIVVSTFLLCVAIGGCCAML